MPTYNDTPITKTASTILTLLGLQPDPSMAAPIDAVLDGAQQAFGRKRCGRILMYHPDAVAMWIYERYRNYFEELEQRLPHRLSMLSPVPPVTPVCFASMYSGLDPRRHGIMKYEKPVLKVKTVFDRMAEEERRAAVVSTEGDSVSRIFLGRGIDYFIYPTKEECNRKALALIEQDRHELIVVYNGDYDYFMHRFSPEGKRPLRALRENTETCCELYDAVKRCWKDHDSVAAFATDHGCHRAGLLFGNHGIDAPCDRNIVYFYGFLPAEN